MFCRGLFVPLNSSKKNSVDSCTHTRTIDDRQTTESTQSLSFAVDYSGVVGVDRNGAMRGRTMLLIYRRLNIRELICGSTVGART